MDAGGAPVWNWVHEAIVRKDKTVASEEEVERGQYVCFVEEAWFRHQLQVHAQLDSNSCDRFIYLLGRGGIEGGELIKFKENMLVDLHHAALSYGLEIDECQSEELNRMGHWFNAKGFLMFIGGAFSNQMSVDMQSRHYMSMEIWLRQEI